MHQTLGAAVRTMIKLLAFAMFLPVITGFDNAAPQSGAAIAPEAVPSPAAQPPPPTAPEGAGTPIKDLEPSAVVPAEPGAPTTKAGSSSKTVHSLGNRGRQKLSHTCTRSAGVPRPAQRLRPDLLLQRY
jgi:hypothetical protein